MATKEKSIRVGLLVTGALIVLMTFLFFIGSEQKIFARKNEYNVQLENVTGLAEGNPVRMSGVTIGVIHDIFLPHDPKLRNVRIQLMIDRKYADRIRVDSRARLKKLGLLTGDTFIEITPGSPRFEAMETGSTIPAQKQTNVDQLISSGEDLVDNLVQISYSMKNILGRVDRGEGLIGELTSQPETKQRLTDTLLTTLNKTNAALTHIESGKGVVGKFIYDDKYAEQLTASIGAGAESIRKVAANVQTAFDSGDGMVPALLHDPEGKKKVYELVDNLTTAASNLTRITENLQKGSGAIPLLLNDPRFGKEFTENLRSFSAHLDSISRKLDEGDGTAGKLINDPALFDAANRLVVGVNESALLRWLIKDRQKAGIKKEYNDAQRALTATPLATATP